MLQHPLPPCREVTPVLGYFRPGINATYVRFTSDMDFSLTVLGLRSSPWCVRFCDQFPV